MKNHVNKRKVNKNFQHLYWTYKHNKESDFKDTLFAILEGSSRSGKTISAIDFLIWYGLNNENKTIFMFRQTYTSHKTTLYTDWDNRLRAFGLDNPFEKAREVTDFRIGSNKYVFLGCDNADKFEGAGCDIAYFNELLDQPKKVWDAIEQRCSEMMIGDYNPKFTVHWVYDNLLRRSDCSYIHTTFADNPFIPYPQKKKILSYEPTQANIEAGTADDYMWRVYGLGLRAAQSGLVFKTVDWIPELPKVQYYNYGLDFGFTADPTCLVKACIIGNDLYVQKLIYQPIECSNLLGEHLHKIGITSNDIIIADSADIGGTSTDGFVKDLRMLGFQIIKAAKGKGSIEEGIAKIKNYRLHIVKDADVVKEQENYIYRTINDIPTNQPVDAFNHFWDAVRYMMQCYREPMYCA